MNDQSISTPFGTISPLWTGHHLGQKLTEEEKAERLQREQKRRIRLNIIQNAMRGMLGQQLLAQGIPFCVKQQKECFEVIFRIHNAAFSVRLPHDSALQELPASIQDILEIHRFLSLRGASWKVSEVSPWTHWEGAVTDL